MDDDGGGGGCVCDTAYVQPAQRAWQQSIVIHLVVLESDVVKFPLPVEKIPAIFIVT